MTVALGAILLVATLAFAATEQWALSIAQCAIFLLGAVCAIRCKLRWTPLALPPAAVAILGLIQLATRTTVHSFATTNAIVTWTAYAILLLVARRALAEPGAREKFLRATLYSSFVLAMLSTTQYFTSDGKIYWLFPTRSGRAFGPFVNPDHYAAFVELILPLAIYQATRSHRARWANAAIAGALYGSVIASASRAGAILTTAEILTLPLIMRRSAVAAKALGFAVVATAVVGWETLWTRFHEPDPFQYRREILTSTLQMIERRPWAGFGLGSFAAVYPEYQTFDIGLVVDHAHNDWAEWTAEGGVPALILLAVPAALTVRRAIRNPWSLGVHAVFLHSLADFPLQTPAIALLLFTLLAALYSDRPSEA